MPTTFLTGRCFWTASTILDNGMRPCPVQRASQYVNKVLEVSNHARPTSTQIQIEVARAAMNRESSLCLFKKRCVKHFQINVSESHNTFTSRCLPPSLIGSVHCHSSLTLWPKLQRYTALETLWPIAADWLKFQQERLAGAARFYKARCEEYRRVLGQMKIEIGTVKTLKGCLQSQ
jgi:hypothetical protein